MSHSPSNPPSPLLRRYARLVGDAARAHDVEPALAWGVLWRESAGEVWAYRYEPGWRWFTDHLGRPLGQGRQHAAQHLSPTEFNAQSASWGLMQVMGSVARELGHRGPISTLLVHPSEAVWLGCKKLGQLTYRFRGSIEDAVSAYNDGDGYADRDNESYVEAVGLFRAQTLTNTELMEALNPPSPS